MLACAKLLRCRSLKTVASLPQRHCFPRSAHSASILAMDKVSFGTDLPGYEIGQKNSPGIIVIQEWWGVTDIVKAQATKLSAKGFRCLVPDLYKGKMSLEAEEASHMMGNLDFKVATAELTQAQEYLRSSGCPKVGVTGFCMGGALAFCAAQHSGVDAAAPFYGTPDASVCQVEKIKVPTLAQFGSQDALTGFSDLPTAEAAIAKMKVAGCPVEFHAYADAGHAFMNAAEGDDAVALLKKNGHPAPSDETLKLAWQRLEEFFKKHLSA